jgi:hypothetical protein
MTREEVKKHLIENMSIFDRILENNPPAAEHIIDWEWKYQNSEYGKNHKYAEIPIEEVD